MNLKSINSNQIFNKKTLIKVYFIFFIFLNIFDFLNFLSGDLDFFKKILSWTLIGYIFYKISFTKLFIGIRDKKIDLILILAFSLMTITKSLMHYINIESTKNATFLIFNSTYEKLSTISDINTLVQNMFIIGLIIIFFSSIYLIRKYSPTKKSLIGSFNLQGYLKFIGGEVIILMITLTFFSIIVFNFFMEWFALSVDALILILGLIYYLITYLHKHTKINTENYLRSISNSGNSFYKNLINNFSNKKTFLIGISFLLTLHLLVDIGVYLLPYILGNGNLLYSDSLNTPLINVFEPKDSILFQDFQNSNGNILIILATIFSYLVSITFFFLLMIAPFYYFYKFILKIKSHSPKFLKYLFLSSSLLYLSLILLPNLSTPISIDIPDKGSTITGVELKTTPFIKFDSQIQNFSDKTIFQVLIFIILILIIGVETNIFLEKSNSDFLKYKLMPLIALLFFLIYISIFFYSTVEKDSKIITDIFANKKIQNMIDENSEKYSNLIKLTKDKKMILTSFEENINYSKINLNVELKAFTNINKQSSTFDENSNHNDYLLITIKEHENIKFENYSKVYLPKHKYEFKTKTIQKNTTIIYFLGENYYLLSNKRGVENIYIGENEINKIISKEHKENNILLLITQIIRLIFITIFYLFGSIAFARYFIREKIRD